MLYSRSALRIGSVRGMFALCAVYWSQIQRSRLNLPPPSSFPMSHAGPSSATPASSEREPAPSPAMKAAQVHVIADHELQERADWIAIEEPLEIRAAGPGQEAVSVAVTMRTPGHDTELAVGFLYTEGLIDSLDQLQKPIEDPARHRRRRGVCNISLVSLAIPFDGSSLKRNFFATSSCGVCGKATLEQIAVRAPKVGDGPLVARSTIIGLPDELRKAQAVFERTGGLHAAGLFDSNGSLLTLREDVGRHNAVDKLIGRAFLDGDLPLADRLLLVSGRTSFEILQKAAVAGIPIICAVSAPSSLAVSVADRLGITLVGFLRGSSFNIYTRPDRIDPRA